MTINRLRMALLVWAAMFPFNTFLNYSFLQLSFTANCSLITRTFLLTCLLVPYMVFGAFPLLNRRFKKWLEATPANAEIRETAYPQGQPHDSQKG